LNTAITLYRQPAIPDILWLIIVSLILALTKETFLPVTLLVYVLVVAGWLKEYSIKKLYRKIINDLTLSWQYARFKLILVLTIILLIVSFGLFAERYAQNYIRYKRTTPACNKVHAEDECMQHGIYRRNTGQRKEYLALLNDGGRPSMNFLEFTRVWLRAVYDRTYSYRGMNTINLSLSVRVITVLCGIIVLIYAVRGLLVNKINLLQKALLIITISYVILVFMYNYNIYRYYGYPFAIQGRYLLPVLPFAYYFVVLGLVNNYHKITKANKKTMIVLLLIFLVTVVTLISPMALYAREGYRLNKQVINHSANSFVA
ncbi:hypothetical protein KDA11_01435, partial [Candidatus Saccharibacteria bacterium]|nr:hypothetical protein [Candidatus Saccharibacteria bacterium]